jgi:hypothetical protein
MKRYWWFLLVGLLGIVTLWVAVATTEAQTQLWTANFYDNPYLYGTPRLRENVASVGFNWGRNSPGANIPADNFSARFTTDAYFSAGTYRFTLTADDGVHLLVDGQWLIDTFDNPHVGQPLTADITLTAAYHSVQVDFHEMGGDAYVYASWVQVSGDTSLPIQSGGAWLAEYFNNRTLSQPSIVVRYENSPSHDWGTGSPVNGIAADNFSVRWTGTQTLLEGIHTMTVTVDDGVRVYVNGAQVLDEWHDSDSTTYTRNVYFRNGSNTVMIEYYEATGFASMQFSCVCTSDVRIPPLEGTAVISPSITGPYATITTRSLNVRSSPFIDDNILRQVRLGHTYPVIGRNSDSSWWQIRAGSVTGWVYSRFVVVSNANNIPITSGTVNPLIPTS